MAKDNTLYLEIISPEGTIFQSDVEEVSLPTASGQITVLPHHTALFTKLDEGEIEIKKDGKNTTIVINGGFLEIKNNTVHVLSDYAIRAESIEIAKAEEKMRKAKELMHEKEGKREFVMAEKDLKKSILELKIAQKIRKKHRA